MYSGLNYLVSCPRSTVRGTELGENGMYTNRVQNTKKKIVRQKKTIWTSVFCFWKLVFCLTYMEWP